MHFPRRRLPFVLRLATVEINAIIGTDAR